MLASPTHSRSHASSVPVSLRLTGSHQPSPARRTAMQVGGGGSGGGGDSADLRGRHRIQAELKKLEQEARFLEEELEELQKADKVSSALQEYVSPAEEMLLSRVFCYGADDLKAIFTCLLLEVDCVVYVARFLTEMGRKADPLLPVSTGPVNPSWDRWFEGPQDLRRCKCWFL